MAFKLSAEQEKLFAELRSELSTSYTAIENAVNVYNESERELRIPIENAVSEYNTKLGEFRTFVDGVAEDKRSEYDDKTESWQEGENGQAADEWISAWEEADLDDGFVSLPEDDVTVGFESHADLELSTQA